MRRVAYLAMVHGHRFLDPLHQFIARGFSGRHRPNPRREALRPSRAERSVEIIQTLLGKEVGHRSLGNDTDVLIAPTSGVTQVCMNN